MASRFKRSVPVTVNDVLDGHVALDLECLDRLYLHGYLGQLQVGGQVIQFLTHRGFKIYSAACLQQIGDGFRRRVASFAEANDIPVVTLKAADRNIEVMRPYLVKAAASGRSQVAAIGVAQEVQRVFLARQRGTDPSKPPQFSFGKKVNGSVWRGVPAKLGWRGGCEWSRAGVAGVRCAARAPAGAVTGSRVADAGVLRNRFP